MATPAQVTCTAGMLDDYLYTAVPPIAANVNSCFVVAQDLSDPDPVNEVLIVNNSNQVVLLSPDSTSNSGYAETVVPVTGAPSAAVSKLLGFYENGQLNVLVHYPAAPGNSQVIWMQQSANSQWTAMPMEGDIGNALGQVAESGVYTSATGDHYIFGISNNFIQPTFFITACQAGTTNWQVTFLTTALSTTYLLLPGLGGDLLNVVWVSGPAIEFRGVQGGGANWQWDANPAQSFNPEQGPLTGDQIVPLPGDTQGGLNPSDFLLLGTNSQLYYISGYNEQFPTLTFLTGQTAQPAGVTQVALGYDAQRLCMIFAIDTSQKLWLLRQTGADSQGNLQFGGWVQLGNTLALAVCPAAMDSGPELFGVDLGKNIIHVYQDINSVVTSSGTTIDGTWFLDFLKSPSPGTGAPQSMPTYTAQFKVFDSDGNVMPQQPLALLADRACVLIVDGISYSVGVNAPALVQTNDAGQATVLVAARNLTAPELTASVPGTSVTLAARLDVQVHNRVAGNDPLFPINGTSLIASGLISTEDDGLAGELATALQTVGQTLVAISDPQQTREVRIRKLAGVGIQQWELDFTTPGQPRFRALTREQAQAHFDMVTGQSVGSWLSDLWGDVCNFVENAVESLSKIVASIVNDVVQIAIEVAGQVKNYVLQTVNQMGDLLETIFVKIAEAAEAVANAIEKAVEWLKLVFDWGDILNTKTVITYYLNSCLNNMAYAAGNGAVQYVQTNFDAAKQAVTNAFEQAQSVFTTGTSYDQFAENANGGSGGLNLLQDQQMQSQYSANAAQCDYIFAKTQANMNGATMAGFGTLALGDTSGYDNLVSTIVSELGESFVEAFQSFQTFLQQATAEPQAFFNQAILVVLEAAKDVVLFVLDAIESVIIALLQAFSAMLTAVQTALNAPLDIPFVSWLYNEIAGSELTILDLVGLILAVPATILYKVIYGGSQATPPFTAAQVTQITSSPIPWPPFLAQPPRQQAALAVTEGAPGDAAAGAVFAQLAALFWLIYFPIDTYVAFMAIRDVDPGPSFWKTAWSWVSLGFEGIIQLFSFPAGSVPAKNSTDTQTCVLWSFFLVPLALDFVCVVFAPKKAVTRFDDKWGRASRTGCGLALLGSGILVSISQGSDPDYDGWNIAGNIIGPLPLCATLLYNVKNPWAILALLGLHAVSDIGMAFVSYMGAPSTEQAEPKRLAGPLLMGAAPA